VDLQTLSLRAEHRILLLVSGSSVVALWKPREGFLNGRQPGALGKGANPSVSIVMLLDHE
jgi:hypothetical protein